MACLVQYRITYFLVVFWMLYVHFAHGKYTFWSELTIFTGQASNANHQKRKHCVWGYVSIPSRYDSSLQVVLKVDITFLFVFTAVDVFRMIWTPRLSTFIVRGTLVTRARALIFRIKYCCISGYFDPVDVWLNIETMSFSWRPCRYFGWINTLPWMFADWSALHIWANS